MNGFALLLATAVLGVDYGWQPASDGRLEYIIQIEPITLIALREGQEVVSQIDPFARDVRRFRIRVGTDVVPRVGVPVQTAAPAFSAAASAPPPGVTFGWQPVNEQQVELIVQLSPERLGGPAKRADHGRNSRRVEKRGSRASEVGRCQFAAAERTASWPAGDGWCSRDGRCPRQRSGRLWNSLRVSGGPRSNGVWHLGRWESASQPAVARRQSRTSTAKRISGSEHDEQSGGAGRLQATSRRRTTRAAVPTLRAAGRLLPPANRRARRGTIRRAIRPPYRRWRTRVRSRPRILTTRVPPPRPDPVRPPSSTLPTLGRRRRLRTRIGSRKTPRGRPLPDRIRRGPMRSRWRRAGRSLPRRGSLSRPPTPRVSRG